MACVEKESLPVLLKGEPSSDCEMREERRRSGFERVVSYLLEEKEEEDDEEK